MKTAYKEDHFQSEIPGWDRDWLIKSTAAAAAAIDDDDPFLYVSISHCLFFGIQSELAIRQKKWVSTESFLIANPLLIASPNYFNMENRWAQKSVLL